MSDCVLSPVGLCHDGRVLLKCEKCGAEICSTVATIAEKRHTCGDTAAKPKKQSMISSALSFAAAAASHASRGFPIASDDEIERRHSTCLQCEFLVDDACSKCGCPISRAKKFISKLAWADQECPVGKWGKSDSQNQS